MQIAHRLGVGVIGYSPLCLGLLTGKYRDTDGPGGVRGFLFNRILKGGGGVVEALAQIAQARGVTPATVAIAWCVSKNVVVITGAKTPEHVHQAVAAQSIMLTSTEIEALESAAAKAPRMIENAFQTS